MRVRLLVRAGGPASGPAAGAPVTVPVTVSLPSSALARDGTAQVLAARLAATLGRAGDALVVGQQILAPGALLGRPPLLDGATVQLVQRARWRSAPAPMRSSATEIAVIAGPDAGASRALTPGGHTVGRGHADLSLADPVLSRAHLRVSVAADGITVTDLGSENGVLLDGAPLGAQPRPLLPGSVIEAGESALTVRTRSLRPATVTARGDGTLQVSPASLAPPGPRPVTIEVPAPPEPAPPRRVPWVPALLPIPVALLLAVFFGPQLLALALLSPLTLLGTYVSERISRTRATKSAAQEYARARERAVSARATALASERLVREHALADLARILRTASERTELLWSRPTDDQDPIALRVGRGEITSAVHWREGEQTVPVPMPGAPVAVELASVGSLAITGPRRTRAMAALIGQLLALHPPSRLQVWTSQPVWAAAPHVRVAPVADLLADAVAQTAGEPDEHSPVIVLAIEGSDLGDDDLATLSAVVGSGPAHGILTLITGTRFTGTRACLSTALAGPGRLSVPDRPDGRVLVDGVRSPWIERLVAALEPLRDGTGQRSGLPDAAALPEILGTADPDAIRAQWQRADDGAHVTLGVTATGPLRFDLAGLGPHALIAGTTGSGKSELLRTLVTSLGYHHRPEDLAVVLIDYKGGAVFAGLETLPHIVGLVTDLDPALTLRALTSLRAEIHRREALFAACGAADLLEYRAHQRAATQQAATQQAATQQAATPQAGAPQAGAQHAARQGTMPSLPPLARLVLVVDEFRALADDVPEFVDGLVRFAAVGRSLGIHLVLATQRPAGVITADMRANLGLRIALRVRDRADSMDVIESAAAAELPLTLPGRALMRSGSESLTALQTAMVTAPAAEPQMSIEVTWSDGTVLRRQFPTTEDQASAPPAAQARTSVPDTDLVSAIATAARAGNHQCAPTPWLPALPPELTWTPEVPATGWALIDLPAEQRQSIEVAEIETLRPTAICGAPGSGRTTSALTLAVASVRSDPERVHVYALGDPGSPLCALTTLPQCGALVDRSDPAAVADLVARLTSELTTRRSEPSPTRLLLVIDGFEVLADACDALDHATVTDRLLSLIRDGHPLGLRAIVTGDHTAATGRVARVCPDRFLHRPADRNQLSLLGVHADAAPRDWPSGRLVRVHDSAQLQVLTRPVEVPRGPARQPWRLQPLPTRLTTAELQRAAILSASSSALASALALGVSSTPGDVVAVGAEQRRRLLLLGSPGSGRTSALTTLAAAAKDGGRQVCIVAEAHTPLAAAARALELPALDWADPEPLIERRREHPDLVVLADDVDRHLESALVPVLEQIADLVERDAGLIAVSGDAAALALRPRGIAASVARGRLAVVLGQPSAPDADLVGVRLPRTRDALPGRGWLIAGRTVTPVQLAVRDTGP